jgi:hypothetical protein
MRFFLSLLAVLALAACAAAPPVNFTAEEDHQDMMDQLGIKALRPGPSGDENAPNHANYDEAKANPYPGIPDPLTRNDGTKVTTAKDWWAKRRPEIVAMEERYVYGRVPDGVPRVKWAVMGIDHKLSAAPLIEKDLAGTVDNASYPAIAVTIHMLLVTPADAKRPVPVLILFGRAGFPGLRDKLDQVIAAGWGYALLDPASVQADNGAGLTRGIIGLVNKGRPRKPEDWGALRAWAWGAGRALDYLETDPAVDAKRVGIEGVSRYGKAALVTMAFDQRFAVALVGSSGKGGATLLRRNFGEAVESLTGGEYHWMAGNFLRYGASDARFGALTPGDIPVDANELIALCAPRPVFISYGIPEKGDAHWLDHRGSFMAAVDASRVYALLGAKGLDGDYRAAEMPPVNHGLLDGQLAWRQHDGGHTDTPNLKWFFPWADKFLGRAP